MRVISRFLSTAMIGIAFVAALIVFAFAPRFLVASLVACASLVLLSVVPLAASARMKSIAAFAPILLLGSAGFAFMLVVENSIGRAATAAVVLALHASYLSLLPHAVSGVEPRVVSGVELSPVFVKVRSSVWLAALFFTLAFLHGIPALIDVPLAALVFAAGVAVAATAVSVLRPEGAPGASGPLIAAFGLLGAETFLALWFLPTAWLVDVAASMILFVLAVQAVAHVGVVSAPAFRHRAVFAAVLVALVFGTARWA